MLAVRLTLVVLGCAVAAACSPVYKTTYELTPPQTAEGRICVTQCQQTQNACKNAGYDRYQRCRTEQRAYAERKFNEYRVQQLLLKQPIKKSQQHFYSAHSCGLEKSYKATCDQDYIGCFSTCGGKATPRTVCTATCEKAQPGPQLSGRPDIPTAR